MQMEDMILVSVDDHVCEPPDMWDAHVPAKWKDRAPKLVTKDDGSNLWVFEGGQIPNVGLNAVAGRPPEEDSNKVYEVPVGNNDAVKGPANAKVTIVEFSEFQCPFCKRVNPTMDQIMKEYGKQVRIVFKHNPLSFHKDAPLASQAALAAGQQGKFWEMHDMLFENQRALKPDDINKYAQELGLNMSKFKADLESDAIKKQIAADQALAGKVGARGTPTFFINGRKLRGAQPFPRFKALIDEELKK